jgi:hypothetical protein
MLAELASGTLSRDEALARYGFAVPSPAAIDAVARWAAPLAGVVEVGAGTGYWSWVLAHAGVDVVASDLQQHEWFPGTTPFVPVVAADGRAFAAAHADRCLLLVWPTQDQTWGADVLDAFADAGGQRVAYVGEGAGGRTGDDRFHRLIGTLDRCAHCDYGILSVPCVKDVAPRYEVVEELPLPRWPGFGDSLHLLAALG